MYRVQIKGKKWWWPIFTNFIDVAKTNAWNLYKIAVDPKISLLEFQRSVALALLKANEYSEDLQPSTSFTHCIGRPSFFQDLALRETRKDPTNHIIEKNPSNKRQRCKDCGSQTITICNKCKVPLHSKCFKNFHVPQK